MRKGKWEKVKQRAKYQEVNGQRKKGGKGCHGPTRSYDVRKSIRDEHDT